MKTKKTEIYQDYDCYYLVLDMGGMNLYERSKAINKFVKNDTKVLENLIESQIKAIFRANGINVNDTDKSGYKRLFDTLKAQGKTISLVDLYEKDLYKCERVAISENYMNVVLEDNRYLQAGIMVREENV